MDFSYLKKYKKILVTGPQRSGTNIAARIIASELSYTHYSEIDVKVRSITSLIEKLTNPHPCVIQGPCFCSVCHWIDTPFTAIILMKRNTEDIILSQNRIKWDEEKYELNHYFIDEGKISCVRYDVFDKYQKQLLKIPYFELEYDELSYHPMWINDRTGFDTRQYKKINFIR